MIRRLFEAVVGRLNTIYLQATAKRWERKLGDKIEHWAIDERLTVLGWWCWFRAAAQTNAPECSFADARELAASHMLNDFIIVHEGLREPVLDVIRTSGREQAVAGALMIGFLTGCCYRSDVYSVEAANQLAPGLVSMIEGMDE